MIDLSKKNENNQILNQLIFDNCLSFGRNPRLNNRKINHYIFGTRQTLDIFKLYELRYLLLKIYPLIHNLFLQPRLNKIKKNKWFFHKNFHLQKKNLQNLPKQFQNKKAFQPLKAKFNKMLKEKTIRPLPPRILFATTTTIYSEIVSNAAKKCRMPFHINRWLSGTITAASYYLTDWKKWSFLSDLNETEINFLFQNKFSKHKKNFEQQKNNVLKQQLSRKPTLIIIPDISNNEMILKETNSVGIPALGLVNSHCHNEVAYPIFANDFSVYSIHFLCHFLSHLILKELVKYKHKVYTRNKKQRALQFIQTNKDFLRFNKWKSYQKLIGRKKIVQKYFFKGQYFINHFLKMRRQKKWVLWKKKIEGKRKKQQKQKLKQGYVQWYFPKTPKIKFVSPKKLISVENVKRFNQNKINFDWKKRIVSKIKRIQKLRPYNYTKILREIRLPNNKPTFRYWNRRKFWFSNAIQFVINTPFGYSFRKYRVKKMMVNKIFWRKMQKLRPIKKKYNKNKTVYKKHYKTRWSPKKSKKVYHN